MLVKKEIPKRGQKMKKNNEENTPIKKGRKNLGRKIFDPVTRKEREYNKKLEEE